MTRRDLLCYSAASAAAGVVCPFCNTLLAQNEPAKSKTPDEMIDAYLAAQVKKIESRFMDGAKTKDEWDMIRPRLKREFLEMVGLDPLPEKTPLKATVTGKIERSGITIEKVHYQSKPGLYVTGNVYIPANPERKLGGGKHPAILYVCGHSGRGRDGNKTAFQDHGLWFASNGYVCLVVDTLQLGEIAGIHHGTYREGRWWWHDRGYTPAGVECWNGVRGIDYLVSRPDVDAGRIGGVADRHRRQGTSQSRRVRELALSRLENAPRLAHRGAAAERRFPVEEASTRRSLKFHQAWGPSPRGG